VGEGRPEGSVVPGAAKADGPPAGAARAREGLTGAWSGARRGRASLSRPTARPDGFEAGGSVLSKALNTLPRAAQAQHPACAAGRGPAGRKDQEPRKTS